jgi:hypothetical protein
MFLGGRGPRINSAMRGVQLKRRRCNLANQEFSSGFTSLVPYDLKRDIH